MYERACLDDMRALRNDSVDVYARASDYVLGVRVAARV
jgi:hypothetical protein